LADHPLLSPDFPLRTDRLLLRPWRPNDREAFAAMLADPGVVRHLYHGPLTAEESARKQASRISVITDVGAWMNLAVEVAVTGQVAGDVGLCWTSTEHRQAEVGYVFTPDHCGRGYATEAVAALVDVAFTDLGAHRVSGRLDARNTASARLLERLGMRREGLLVENELVKGEWTSELVYAVLDREWSGRPYPVAKQRNEPPPPL